jgi:hypothetical protein
MLNRKGNLEIKTEENTFGFRFTTWGLKETQKAAGCKGMLELFTKIGFDDSNIDLDTFILLLMEAAREYNYYEKKEVELSPRIVSEWIDEMGGVIVSLGLISEGLKQFVPKNSQPPATGETSI